MESYKDLYMLAKELLLASLKGEPVSVATIGEAICKTELAIDIALITDKPTSQLESINRELHQLHKAAWYANGAE